MADQRLQHRGLLDFLKYCYFKLCVCVGKLCKNVRTEELELELQAVASYLTWVLGSSQPYEYLSGPTHSLPQSNQCGLCYVRLYRGKKAILDCKLPFFLILKKHYILMYLMCVFMCYSVCTHTYVCSCEGQRAVYKKSHFSPFLSVGSGD